ncbi:hypothetical protein SUDANB1_05644 [Streptomyces sp. enrichment culture]|uniref:hypothetical protein n=1 Tax=Streptomyces sp. enrichment culture TaxID=1795815 RepID=UPI003F57605F
MADTETGVTHLGTETRPLHELTPYPGNARRGDVPSILESLCRNGQYRGLVVRDEGNGRLVVLAGNHTLQALAAHGPGPCGLTVKVGDQERPCAVCQGEPWAPSARCERITCDDDTARRIVLVDNRAAEKGGWDEQALADLLAGLDGDLTGTAYSETDIDTLLESLDVPEEFDDDDYDDEPEPARPVAEQPTAPAAAAALEVAPAAEQAALVAEGIPAATPAASAAPVAPGLSAGLTVQFSHERVPMVLHYPPEDRDEAARLVTAARETFPGDEAPAIVLRALRTLVAVLDSKHDPDGVVTLRALQKAAGASS